jgi:hypothetical protein
MSCGFGNRADELGPRFFKPAESRKRVTRTVEINHCGVRRPLHCRAWAQCSRQSSPCSIDGVIMSWTTSMVF